MKKIINDWSTTVELTDDEAKMICKLGLGEECCAFLVMGAQFECIRMNASYSGTIFSRLEEGSMNAKGEGGWEGCAWEGEI